MQVQTENPALVRDVHSKALLLNDRGAADDYKSRRAMFARQAKTEQEVILLRQDINEIKNLLIEALKK